MSGTETLFDSLPRVERLHVERLQKRRDHLAERTAANPNLTYDRTELKALNWALRLIEVAYHELDADTLNVRR